MDTSLTGKAKRIIKTNLYMTLATTNGNSPWSTPVFYAQDEDYNFYWYSRKDTRHSQNIASSNKVSVSIFSNEGEDGGVGVYIEGKASEITNLELDHAIEIYAQKGAQTTEEKNQFTVKEDFLDSSPLRMYKIIPEKIYISSEATKWKGKWIDSRSEIKLTT